MPVPVPTTTPHSSTSCQGAVISGVKATPDATSTSDITMVVRTPRRSMKAAANGPISPYRIRLIATANEMVARDQPNSCSTGTIRMLGMERMPAATSSVTKVIPATYHP